MDLKQSLHIYGLGIANFETSPFEAVDILHRRSSLERQLSKFDLMDLEQLQKFDQKLFDNAQKMYNHICVIYDFTNSNEPIEEWWWHLDKVVHQELIVDVENKSVKLLKTQEENRVLVEFSSDVDYQLFEQWAKGKHVNYRRVSKNQKII